MRRLTLFVAALLAVVSMGAENLTTYYSRIDGLKKEELKTTLGSIIKNHKSLGYSNLGSYYPDVYYCDGSTKGSSKAKVYDLFSDEVYLYSSSSIWNKEHVVPKSWWGGSESAPQGNDIFSVIPSQTTANSNKSNYPPGIVNRNKSYKDSGRQLVGEATAGTGGSYSKVWEPYDDYKGDFARIIFYVATCYADVAWGSKSTVDSEIDKNSWPTLKPWLYQMLLKWHNDDPVSAKEIQINDDAQAVQGNRNPFIDYPILADYIWGSLTTTAFDLAAAVPHRHIKRDSLTATLSQLTGILTISGIGSMCDRPWYDDRQMIHSVIIKDGVVNIMDKAFKGCNNLTSIVIPESVTNIGDYALEGCPLAKVVNLSNCNINVPTACKVYIKGNLVNFTNDNFVYSNSAPVTEHTKGSAPFIVSLMESPSLEKDVGTYTAKYKFHFFDDDLEFDATIPYTYTITPAPVTVNVTSTSREYGDVNPEFDYIVNGLFESDAIDVTLTAPDYRSKAGSYSFTASTTAKNYSIVNTTGTLTITKAPLTVTADSYTKTYGNANPKFTARYQGFKNDESSSVLTASPTISSQATVSSPVGEYAITSSGGAAQNYEFTEYVPGTLTITKAPLTITADNVSRLYFEDAEYTFRSKGWKNNEDASVLTALPTLQCAAEKATPAGVYDIVPSEAEAQNYEISYQNGSLTIGKRTLAVTAKDAERCYGEENPEFECSFDGFVNDETAAVLTTMPEAVTTAEQWSDVGTYSIVMQGGEATNYKFSYVNGQLSVLRAPQKIEWEQELGTVAVGSQVLLTAKATSGLEIEFKYDAELAEIYPTFDGLVLDCLKEGVLTIRATQEGNQNYHPAERVVKTINIVSTGIASVIQEGEDAIYDLQGRKVLEAVKGFYLQNGKKVYRK